MPTVMTVMAANALPMIIVNRGMAIANTMMPTVTLPSGMILLTRPAMTCPTPAFVKRAPSAARSIGSMDSGPTMSRRRLESSKNTLGVFSFEKNISMIIATMTPTPTPTSGLIFVNTAKSMAKVPMERVGRNIL